MAQRSNLSKIPKEETITLSNIKKILDDYTVEYKKIYGRFAAEDMPIKHLRKDYELMSKYFTQDEILDWDKHQLSSIFEIICTITIDPAYTPLYETLGKFQKLLGLCTDGSAHNYELDVIWDTPADTPDNWKMLYDRRGHLKEISTALNEYDQLNCLLQTNLPINQACFEAMCHSNESHPIKLARGLYALRLGGCCTPENVDTLLRATCDADTVGKALLLKHKSIDETRLARYAEHLKATNSDLIGRTHSIPAERPLSQTMSASIFTLSLIGLVVSLIGVVFLPVLWPALVIFGGVGLISGVVAHYAGKFRKAPRVIRDLSLDPFHLEMQVAHAYLRLHNNNARIVQGLVTDNVRDRGPSSLPEPLDQQNIAESTPVVDRPAQPDPVAQLQQQRIAPGLRG